MRGSSVPVLHLRPQFLQRLLEPSAIEHVGMLVRHRVWVVHARDLMHARKQLLEALLAIIHDDHLLDACFNGRTLYSMYMEKGNWGFWGDCPDFKVGTHL